LPLIVLSPKITLDSALGPVFTWGKPEIWGISMRAVRVVLCGLFSLALLIAGFTPPALAATTQGMASPARALAKSAPRALPAVVAPAAVQPPRTETATARQAIAQLFGLGTGPSPRVNAPKASVPMTSDGWSVSLSYTATTVITLTPSWNQEISGTGNWVYIYDVSAPGGPRRVNYCTSGTSCSITTIPTESQSTYQAFIGQASNSFPSPVLASSVTVTPPAWSISLAESVGPQVTMTATTNYDMSAGVAATQIWDSSGGGYLRLCSQGTSCSTATTPQRTNTSFIAFVAPAGSNNYPTPNAYATSNSVVPPPWNVSLSVSGSNVVATTNYQTGN
jgi:hypothetical protein